MTKPKPIVLSHWAETIKKIDRFNENPNPNASGVQLIFMGENFHFTKNNFSSFVTALLSDEHPERKKCIVSIKMYMCLYSFLNADAPTPYEVGEFLGSLPNLSKLELLDGAFPNISDILRGAASTNEFPLKDLDLYFDELMEGLLEDPAEASSFAEALKACTGLTSFALNISNWEAPAQNINPILEALASLPDLSVVSLGTCEYWIPPQGCAQQLSQLFACPKLKTLGISGQAFSMASAAIQSSTTLQELHIFYMDLKQQGAALTEILQTNRVLQALDLSAYECQEEQLVGQLLEELKNNTTIKSLTLDLKTCESLEQSFLKEATMVLEMLKKNTTIVQFETFHCSYSTEELSEMGDAIHYQVLLNNLGRKDWRNEVTCQQAITDALQALPNLSNISIYPELKLDREPSEFRKSDDEILNDVDIVNVTYNLLREENGFLAFLGSPTSGKKRKREETS